MLLVCCFFEIEACQTLTCLLLLIALHLLAQYHLIPSLGFCDYRLLLLILPSCNLSRRWLLQTNNAKC
uniref:Uncharacterized protein n=1 Tax=Arundo donax TaxID=35708 RepID=A0A0A9HWP7_ARUDO